jgi:hypothetical protein
MTPEQAIKHPWIRQGLKEINAKEEGRAPERSGSTGAAIDPEGHAAAVA